MSAETAGESGAGLSFQEIRADLRGALREVAESEADELGERIDRVEELIDRYEAKAEGKGAENPDEPSRLLERIAAARVEMERLRVGEISRRDAVGRIRLILLSGPGDREEP